MTNFKNLSHSNLDEEHICCAFSDNKCSKGYKNKKVWLKDRLEEGYVFRKLDVRGKVFIEYIPAEFAWLPLHASDAMLINCFWVSGRFKGQGFGKELLEYCIEDSKQRGFKSIITVTSATKKPFLSDGRFLKKFGFRMVDSSSPYFELLQYDLIDNAPVASIKDVARKGKCDVSAGLSVYYTNACPFNDYYVNEELKKLAATTKIPLTIKEIKNREQAQSHFVPHSLYSVFYNGEFLTHQILNKALFEKLLLSN